jgi:cbb3-type cytochrome oxidase subunit 3
VIHGHTYLFDVNATDHDGDPVTYSISSIPNSDITIDEFTGLIEWTATMHIFDQEPFKLEVKVTVMDGRVYLNRSFSITILATEPPEVELLGPSDGMKSASTGIVLKWVGTDPENEPITYNIYLHKTEAFVQALRDETLIEEGYDGDNITIGDLESGKRYFWTVIPDDGCSLGTCNSGVMSFRVNYKPIIRSIEDQQIPAGTEFKFKVSCTDEDQEDLQNLRYSLVEAPVGMTIIEDTGMIKWTPKDNQVLLHTVTVQVTDGIENSRLTFEIEVTEGESTASAFLITFAIVIIALILLALIFFLVFKKKKQMDEEARRIGEEERAELEKEREEEYTSYEEIYGVPAPQEEEEEEELTTEELRDRIHEQIEQLEHMEMSEE